MGRRVWRWDAPIRWRSHESLLSVVLLCISGLKAAFPFLVYDFCTP